MAVSHRLTPAVYRSLCDERDVRVYTRLCEKFVKILSQNYDTLHLHFFGVLRMRKSMLLSLVLSQRTHILFL
jgi:hypothetical protein